MLLRLTTLTTYLPTGAAPIRLTVILCLFPPSGKVALTDTSRGFPGGRSAPILQT